MNREGKVVDREVECRRIGCDASVPVCRCGVRWSHRIVRSGKTTSYTSQEVASRFVALYGQPATFQFVAVSGDGLKETP